MQNFDEIELLFEIELVDSDADSSAFHLWDYSPGAIGKVVVDSAILRAVCDDAGVGSEHCLRSTIALDDRCPNLWLHLLEGENAGSDYTQKHSKEVKAL